MSVATMEGTAESAPFPTGFASGSDLFSSWGVNDELLAKIRDKTVRDRVRTRSRLGEAVGAIDAAGILTCVPDDLGTKKVGRAGWTDEQLVNMIGSAHKLACWAAAVQFTAIAAWATECPPVNKHDKGFRDWEQISMFCVDEIAVACSISTQSASGRLYTALALVDWLRPTLAALRRGDIDAAKARTMADLTSRLTPAQAAAVEEAVLNDLIQPEQVCSYRRWETRIREAVDAVDPKSAEDRRTDAVAERKVDLIPAENGMADLWAHLPADDALAIHAQITQAAMQPPGPGDTRTFGQRRADALTDAVLGRATHAARTPLIQVTVDTAVLAGLSDRPARLDGYGPITAEAARELAADGTWRRLLTDPASGGLLDYGTKTYRPPANLARHVKARDQVCRFPTCERSASRCDLDHDIPHPEGRTAADNLNAKCLHAHRLKGETTWHTEQLVDGSVLWVTAGGHACVDPPRPVLPPDPPKSELEAESEPHPVDDIPPF